MGVPSLKLDDYQRLFPAAARALALHEDLRTLLHEGRQAPAGLPNLDTATIEAAWASGRPVVDRVNIGPSAGPLRQILRQVSEILVRHLPAMAPVAALADPHKLDDPTLLRLGQEAAASNAQIVAEGVRATGAHPTGTAFALSFAVSVFYHAARRHLPADIDMSVWQRQACPVCAAAPSIAKDVAEGRMAFCHRCSTQWSVPRDLCLACGTRDKTSRLRLEMPGDGTRYAEVCRDCRQHTKIVDQTRLGAFPDLYLEDVITLPLDQLAREAAQRQDSPVLAAAR